MDLQNDKDYTEYLEKLANSVDLQHIEYELCRKDPYHWLTTWAYTIDPHDRTNPVKRFPARDYIKRLVDIWLKESLLLIPKSRQMMVSWLFCSLYLWDTQFYPGRLNFFQSKKEEDADALIRRAKFIYDKQPVFLRRYRVNPSNTGRHIYCKLELPEIQSMIRGIPQGGDQIRMHTASGIFSDEMGFQSEAEAAYTAAKPTIDGGGKFTGVSTAEPGFFADMVEDAVEIEGEDYESQGIEAQIQEKKVF